MQSSKVQVTEGIAHLSNSDAIKLYFGQTKPVTNQELLELRRADPESYDAMAVEARQWIDRLEL